MSSKGTGAVLLLCAVLGCGPDTTATARDCEAILDRIVALELREMGFSDPELERRHQEALRKHFAGSLSQCVGRPLREGAMACVTSAPSTEALSHECF